MLIVVGVIYYTYLCVSKVIKHINRKKKIMQKFTVTYSDNRASKTIEELDINYALLNVVDSEDFKTDVFSNDENNDGEIEVDGYGIVIRNEQGNEIPFSINLKEQSAYGELDGISFEIKLIQ